MGSSLANGLDAAPRDDLMGINEVRVIKSCSNPARQRIWSKFRSVGERTVRSGNTAQRAAV